MPRRPVAPGVRLGATHTFARPNTCVVDLTAVAWIDPVHLVAVAAMAYAARRDGMRFELRGPAAPERARYAARMRLGVVVTALGGAHDLPEVPGADSADGLVEVAVVDDHRDVDRVARLVHDRVADLDLGLAHALHQGVSEIGENACDYSGTAGFVAAQTIPRRGELRFAVADPGVGLLATLETKGARTDQEAIHLALSGVSSRNRHGTGLPDTVRAVTRLGGDLYLASGRASVAITHAQTRNSIQERGFAGTLVEGRIPINAARDRARMDVSENQPTQEVREMADGTADLILPRLVAGREFADDMADRLGDVTDRHIVVDATALSSGTSSFATQLVTRILVQGGAAELLLVGAPRHFVDYARLAAGADEHAGRLAICADFPVAIRR